MTSSWLNEVRVATVGSNIMLTGAGTPSLDGVTLAAGDRILVKDQTDARANGIYLWASGGATWPRASDFSAGTTSVTPEARVRASEGTVNAHTGWFLTTPVTSGVLTVGPAGGGSGDNLFFCRIWGSDYKAASAFAVGQIFRSASGGQVTPATSALTSVPFAGVSLQALGSGNIGAFVTSGIVDPNIFSLGAGIACAVGANSSGTPVRATDPACASHKNWVGFCDTNGVITVQPTQRAYLWAFDYGAIQNDSGATARAQNVAAHRAMLAAVTAFDADEIRWPQAGQASPFYMSADPRNLASLSLVPNTSTHAGTGTGVITPSGTPALDDYAFVVTIKAGGGFRYSLDGGLTDNGSDISIPSLPGPVAVGTTGVTLNFSTGTYVATDTYKFSAWRPAAWHLTRPCTIRGMGGTSSFGTVIKVPDGVTAVRTWCLTMSPPGPDTDSDSSGSIISDIVFWAEGSTDLTAHGVDCRALTLGHNGISLLFGGNGVNVESRGGGRPDVCYFTRWNAYQNQNGMFLKGGDTNVCNFVSCQFNANRGYGYVDHSFLGCNLESCQMAENMLGPFLVNTVGSSTTKGMYSEADQPPGVVQAGAVWDLGGQESAGYATGSARFGGTAGNDLYPCRFTSRAGAAVTAVGTSPPPMALQGNVTALPANVRIEVTTAGYPAGFDSFHVGGHASLVIRWSVDGGSSWTSGVSPTRADQNAVFGNSTVTLGSSGLTAFFVPYFYSIDNVYTSANTAGGPQSYLTVSSNDGTGSVWKFGHTLPAVAGSDPAEHRFRYETGNFRWEETWANTRSFLGDQIAGGRGLPYPGSRTRANGYRSNDDSWTVNERHNLIGWADGAQTLGGSSWLTSLNSSTHWFSPGDIVYNRSQTAFWPLGWRASTNGGWSGPGAAGTGWSSGAGMYPGYSIEVGGFVYRSNSDGNLAVGSLPGNYASHQTVGSSFADGNCTMVCMGTVGNPFEAIGSASEGMQTLNCTAGGTFALVTNSASATLRSDYQRYKLTGTPAANFNVTIDKGAAGSWTRAVYNSTAKVATVAAAEGGAGQAIPANTCWNLFHDGTQLVHVV